MTEFLKDKFSSRPPTDKYRKGWDQIFGQKTDPGDAWVCLECGKRSFGGHSCAYCGTKKE